MLDKKNKRNRRHKKIRAKIFGTKTRPRLCVFRSANHIYAQLVDDENNKIIASASDLKIKRKKEGKITASAEVGKSIAKAAAEKKIDKVVFDRGGFVFHGRIKSVADAAREEGLNL